MSESRKLEPPEYAKMVRRMVRALGARIGDSDPHDLAEFAAVQAELDAALRSAIAQQRTRSSWAEIADGLGVTKQTAWSRFSTGEPAQGDIDLAV